MNLPERYLEVVCVPKNSDYKPFGILDRKEKELHVFTKEGIGIWCESEIKESFEALLNLNGIKYDLDKVLRWK